MLPRTRKVFTGTDECPSCDISKEPLEALLLGVGFNAVQIAEMLVSQFGLSVACVAGGIRGHKGGSLKYRRPKN